MCILGVMGFCCGSYTLGGIAKVENCVGAAANVNEGYIQVLDSYIIIGMNFVLDLVRG